MLSLFRRISVSTLLLCLLMLYGPAPSAEGQAITGTLEGTVTDVQGAALKGAKVTIRNTGTGITYQLVTDEGGRYHQAELSPGVYDVTAAAENFSTVNLTSLKLDIAQVRRSDISMPVGGASDSVSVEAEALTTETETSSNGQVIDNKKVVELPLANRQFYALAQLAPGVLPPAQNSSLGFRGGFNVNGAPETNNQFLVNGTFNNDMGTNQPSFRPSVETIAEFKVLSGVYSAEYGRFSGGQIVMVTKQGTNRFHGSAYEFIRNGAIEAKAWGDTSTKPPAFKQNTFGATIGGPVIRDKAFFFFGYEGQRIRQQFALKSTVPTSWAQNGCLPTGTQLYNPYTGTALTMSTTGACAGVPGGGYDITRMTDGSGVVLWNTQAATLGRLMAKLSYPLPNTNQPVTNAGVPGNDYLYTPVRRETMDEYNVRGDYKYSEKDAFYGTWNYFHDPSYEPYNSLCSSRTLPNFGCFTDQMSTLANVGYIRTIRPTVLNDVRLGFSRLVQPRIQEDNTTIGSQWPGLSGAFQGTAPNNLGLPAITLQNYTSTGGQTNLPQNRWTNHWQFSDTLTWSHRAHTFKFGYDMTDVKSTEYEITTGRGSISFSASTLNTINGSNHKGTTNNAFGDMLLGIPSSTSATDTAPITYNRFHSFDFFAMDDWKITPYLTLNLGLRYELNTPVSEKYGQISSFSPVTQTFQVAAWNGTKTVYQTDRNNFAPRLGFAWQPFKNDKTVVKSGFGVFYQEPILYNEFLSYSLQYPIRYPKTFTPAAISSSTASANSNYTLDAPFGTASNLPTPGTPYCPATPVSGCTNLISIVSGTSVDPHYATPYWDEWSLGVQRQVSKSAVAEVLYYGSKGTRLNGNSVLNYNSRGAESAATATTQAHRVYPQWGAISNHKTGFNSEFNSLQGRIQQSTKGGITLLLSYTYGKSLDGLASAQNPNPAYVANGKPGSQSGDKELSAFDVRHRIAFSPVVALPFGRGHSLLNSGLGSAIAGGWQVSGIWQWMTGRPISITDGSVSSGSYGGGDRPNLVADINAGTDTTTGAKTRTAAEWFNIHAIGTRAAGTFGNAAPNPITGPGFNQIDLTVARTFAIREYAKMQFRVEGFNIANHPNFMSPSAAYTGTSQLNAGSGFGAITAANGMREIQGSIRITY